MINVGVDCKIKVKKEAQQLLAELKALEKYRVLVGVPEENSKRKEGTVSNAFLAFIHDNGSPLNNIPARAFMKPGIAKVQSQITANLKIAAAAALNGTKEGVSIALNTAGLIAQNSIRNIIRTGEGFAPLKRGTLLGRMRQRRYLWKRLSKWEKEDVMQSLHPLVNTGQLLKSITYVVETSEGVREGEGGPE